MRKHSRRGFISLTGLTMTGGCLSSRDESTDSDDSGGSENDSEAEADLPERCNLETSERQGNGGSISEVVNLKETENPVRDVFEDSIETENTDNLEEDSAWAAAEIAFRKFAGEFDIEMAGDPPPWLFPATSISGETISSHVIVQAEIDGHSNSYEYCPPSEYESERAVETVPTTVTVTLQSPDGDELHEQEHEIFITEEVKYLD